MKPKKEGPRKLRQGWWRGFQLQITPHALQRASQRLSERFGGLDRQYVAKMCAGAIYRPKEKVRVIYNSDERETRQVAIPLCYTETGEVLGYLVLDNDKERESGCVAKTWLNPDAWQIRAEFEGEPPSWYLQFRRRVEEGSHTPRKTDKNSQP